MSLHPDDVLLGEKMNNYCSSSEDESEDESGATSQTNQAAAAEYTGFQSKFSKNTGPKGVIRDYQRYKQLEAEKRSEADNERVELMKKLSIQCRTSEEDEVEKLKDDEFLAQIEGLDDDFLKEYRKKRIEEMRRAYNDQAKFGKVISLRAEDFVDAIEKEQPSVTVVVHVYEDDVPACETMNGCLECLAKEYFKVKFCRILAHEAQLSHKFREFGLPALLVYKRGELIGSFIRMSDELGDDFFSPDVESTLVEHGMLPDPTLPK